MGTKKIKIAATIKWSRFDGGCTDFSHAPKPKIQKMGTSKKNGDPIGTHKLKKVPMRDPGPQIGTRVGGGSSD